MLWWYVLAVIFTYKTIKTINSRINYLFRKKPILTTSLRRLLCNALIQSHFNYECTAWYPNLCKTLKNKIQTTQNKCVQFCLNLYKMGHISQIELEKLNWLAIRDRINQCILSTTFKFANDIGPNYLNEVFQWAVENNGTLRNDYLKLKHPSQNNCWSKFTFFFRSLKMEQIARVYKKVY